MKRMGRVVLCGVTLLSALATQIDFAKAESVGATTIGSSIPSWTRTNFAVGDKVQECMLCLDDYDQLHENEWMYAISWGGVECAGYGTEFGPCVSCDEFEYWQDSDDCGEGADTVLRGFGSELSVETFQDEHGCEAYLCNIGQAPSPQALLALVEGEDMDLLARVIFQSDGAVFLNKERGAVQSTACGGTINAHIPISSDATLALSRTIAWLENFESPSERMMRDAPKVSAASLFFGVVVAK